jgi:hypothetical protein
MAYQAGDISRPPVIPHDLGRKHYQLADSPLRRGIIPANVSQKKYIGAQPNFQPLSSSIMKVTRPKLQPRQFLDSIDPTAKLAREIEKQKEERAKTGISQAEIIKEFAKFQEIGPREHAGPGTLESEGVRTNLASATAIAQYLAQQPSAPTADAPSPDHHFLHGGSLKQKKKLQRKIEQRQRIVDANIMQKTRMLVDRNLAELQRITETQQPVLPGEIDVPVAQLEAGRANPGRANPGAGFSASPGLSKGSSTKTMVAVIAGVALVGILALVAVTRPERRASRKTSRR